MQNQNKQRKQKAETAEPTTRLMPKTVPFAEVGVGAGRSAFMPRLSDIPEEDRPQIQQFLRDMHQVKDPSDMTQVLVRGIRLSQKLFGACAGYFYQDWNRLAHTISAGTDGRLKPADSALILAFLSPRTHATINEAAAVNLALDLRLSVQKRWKGGAVNALKGVMENNIRRVYDAIGKVMERRDEIAQLLQRNLSEEAFEEALWDLFGLRSFTKKVNRKREEVPIDPSQIKQWLMDFGLLRHNQSLKEAFETGSHQGIDTLLQLFSEEPEFFFDEKRRKVLQFLFNILNPENKEVITADTQMFEFFGLFTGLKVDEQKIIGNLLFEEDIYPVVLEDMTNLLRSVRNYLAEQGVHLTNAEIQAYLWQLIRFIREAEAEGAGRVMPMQRFFPRTVERLRTKKEAMKQGSKRRQAVERFLELYDANQSTSPQAVQETHQKFDEIIRLSEEDLRTLGQIHQTRPEVAHLKVPQAQFEEELRTAVSDLMRREQESIKEGLVSAPAFDRLKSISVPFIAQLKGGGTETIDVPLSEVMKALGFNPDEVPTPVVMRQMAQSLKNFIFKKQGGQQTRDQILNYINQVFQAQKKGKVGTGFFHPPQETRLQTLFDFFEKMPQAPLFTKLQQEQERRVYRKFERRKPKG